MPKEKKMSHGEIPGRQRQSWFGKLSTPKKDLVCVLVLYLLVFVLFNKIILRNMIFSESGDTAAAFSWGEAGRHLQQAEHIEPQWFPYVFSGMPSFGPLAYIPRNINFLQTAVHFIGKLLFLNVEMSWMVLHYFLGGVFMFFLLRYLGFEHSPSLLGAITVALSPYAVGLASGGHGSKLMALSYLPLIFLLTHAAFQRRDVLSLGLLSAALGTLFLTNHIQMVFYVLLVIGLYFLYESILDVRKQPGLVLKRGALLGLALAIGFAISAYVYLSVREYSQYSIRGGGQPGAGGGLPYDYATNWSFHPFEMMNLLMPSFFGFRTPYYWGWMPFTESSVYIGLVPLLLGLLALIYRRNRQTIFQLFLLVVIFLISFGKHFPVLYDLLYNYLPYFNKFRTPSMILHLLPFVVGLLAAYGMTFLLEIHDRDSKINTEKLRKALVVVMVALGGILVLGFIARGTLYDSLSGFMFVKEDQLAELRAQYGEQARQVLEQLKRIRFDLLWSGKELGNLGFVWGGYVRFALFTAAGLVLILFYLNRKVKSGTFSAGLVTVLAFDLLLVDGNFIHPKPNTALKNQFEADETIRFLKADTSRHRIFPLGELFQDNTYMYHQLESIGGYSPAKIKIYQEMIDSCLFRGWEKDFPLNMNIVNMLNVKYLLSQGRLPGDKFQIVHVDQAKPLVTSLNPSSLPRAFFVDEAIVAPSKSEVFGLLNSPTFNPRRQAILEKEPSPVPMKPDTSTVRIKKYGAHEIILETYSDKPALLVLSEVYYPIAWKAYVDENEAEIYKTNYILRSVLVPEGKHAVVFRYHSKTYDKGLTISLVGWGISFLLIVIGAVFQLLPRQGLLQKARLHTSQT